MSHSLRNMHSNARAALVTQPIWSVLGNLFTPFITLYMLAVGCTNQQVGAINAIGMIVGTAVAFFAGWITDRLGRRLANALGDLIGWAFTCLVWGLSQNVVWFIFAAVAQSFIRLSSVAWNCVLSEGTDPEHRMHIFWWFNVVQTVTIFVTPLMNIFIRPFGLVPTMRFVLICSSFILTAAVIIRYRMMQELPVGAERKEIVKKESPLDAIKAYIPMLRIIKDSPLLLINILLRTLFFVQVSLKGTFLPVTIVHGMGFENEIIGTLNIVTGAVMLLAQFVMLSRLQRVSNDKALAVGLVTLTLSILLMVFAPAHSLVLLIISTILYAGGSVATTVLVNTSLTNALPDKERAQLLSLVTVITMAISAPAVWLGGILADIPKIGTRLPMVLISVLCLLCLALLWYSVKIKRRTQEQN